MAKKAVILVNVGTPAKPAKKQVRQYLREFLNDRRVIDLPWLGRKLLVNGIIIPFRVGKSTGLYRRLWTPEGSPLLFHLEKLTGKLNERFGDKFAFYGAMRYGQPALEKILKQAAGETPGGIIIFPLYPQYASATTGSVNEHVMKVVKDWEVIPGIRFVDQFYDHPAFTEAFARLAERYDPSGYDHIVFSYHGLPDRQINKTHPGVDLSGCQCHREMPVHGHHCYRAACFATTRMIAARLGLGSEKITTAFQSRLSKNWLSPFTDDCLVELAKQGARRVLVVSPSFVADCLETTIEIGEDYRALFLGHGGGELVMVPSLNHEDLWVEAIGEMLQLQ